MKRLYILMLTGLSATLFGACKKQLTETPYNFLTPSNFYQTASDALSAVEGCLSALQPQAYYQRTIYIMTELPGDCLTPLLTQNQERIDMYKIQYTPTNPEIANWWQNSYKLISRTNDVILNVPNIKMDAASKNNLLGNAYFLRGMAYFDLVRSFGSVPLLLRPVTGPNDTLMFPHQTDPATIYKQIISDLQFAEANCLTEDKIASANKGMVSSGAASAMLARVYLQRASTTFADANDNQNALTECNKVISSNIYALMPAYSDVFNWSKKFYPTQKEVIFAVQFGANGSNITQNITCRMFSPSGLGGSGSFQCNANFFNNGYPAYDTIRRNWNVSNKVGSSTVSPFIYKYRDPSWVAGTNNSQMNWIVLRYADVLLMQSEAMNNINASDPNKFNGINAVRARAGIIDPTLVYNFGNVVTPDNFVDTLVKERARELCVEGHRRWDLIRLGRYKQVEAGIGFTITDNQMLLPLPQTELDANKNLVQNKGYTQ